MSKSNTIVSSGTNWERLRTMTDDEIDTSDIPPLTEEFFQNAQLRLPDGTRRPIKKKPAETVIVSVEVPPETLAFYQSLGDNPQLHMETVLSEYAALHKDAPVSTE